MIKKTIAIDFDGVLHGYSKGWQDGKIYDVPKPGAKEAMEKLHKNFWLIIYSTRNYDRVVDGVLEPNQRNEMREWLEFHKIPFDQIHTDPGKPICKCFVDDNAVRFESWETALPQIYEHCFK